MVSNRPRIAYLDGLRFVAILSVVLFHYFTHWTKPSYFENLYPYGDVFSSLFQYGYFGVHLFFIISGFVITLTLYRCTGPLEFAIRRFARLWPSMALCSLLTLALVRIIPNHSFQVPVLGLLPSLTFVDPIPLGKLIHVKSLDWIDGSYWSLFVEVRFYVLVALVFFWRKNKFPRNVILFGGAICAVSLLAGWLHLDGFFWVVKWVFGPRYLPWFMIGIAFFWLHHDTDHVMRSWLFVLSFVFLGSTAITERSVPDFIAALLLPLIFFSASRIASICHLLSIGPVTGIGAASYSLYLLHQSIGVALIGWLGRTLNFTGQWSALLTIAVMFGMACIAKLIYLYWETPLNRTMIGIAQPLLQTNAAKIRSKPTEGGPLAPLG